MAASSAPRPPDLRKERARAPRRRMIDAAYKLFTERGYGVPLTDIAREAGVAVQTLYFPFHTKVELMSAVLHLAVLGEDLPPSPLDQPWFEKMLAEPDPRKALQRFCDGSTDIFVRVGPLSPSISRSGDPDVDAMWASAEQLRVDVYRRVMGALVKKGRLRRGLTIDENAATCFVLSSPHLLPPRGPPRGWAPHRRV